jgi:hypothetical protein
VLNTLTKRDLWDAFIKMAEVLETVHIRRRWLLQMASRSKVSFGPDWITSPRNYGYHLIHCLVTPAINIVLTVGE